MSTDEKVLKDVEKFRVGNMVTVLLPARRYKIDCAWTTERTLPAIEIFSCKLLLIMEELLPKELQEYFGLTNREREVLITDLIEHRLIVMNASGHIEPSSLLKSQTRDENQGPMLMQYEERLEYVTFESLTMSVKSSRSFNKDMFGLPEIPAPANINSLPNSDVVEHFNRQYRSFLDADRRPEHHKRSKLYKVSSCTAQSSALVAIDVAFAFEPSDAEPRRLVEAFEKGVAGTRRPLSHDLEGVISDYLGSLALNHEGLHSRAYCVLTNDEVLERYAKDYTFDYSKWLLDRSGRRTGYGNANTKGLFGPAYLPKNTKSILEMVQISLLANQHVDIVNPVWFRSSVPLWGAVIPPKIQGVQK